MDKLKIVLDLVRKGLITDEQAQVLLSTEKEYVYYPRDVYRSNNWPWIYPAQPNIIYTSEASALGCITTTASSNQLFTDQPTA